MASLLNAVKHGQPAGHNFSKPRIVRAKWVTLAIPHPRWEAFVICTLIRTCYDQRLFQIWSFYMYLHPLRQHERQCQMYEIRKIAWKEKRTSRTLKVIATTITYYQWPVVTTSLSCTVFDILSIICRNLKRSRDCDHAPLRDYLLIVASQCAIVWRCLRDSAFSRFEFDRIPACDEWTSHADTRWRLIPRQHSVTR